MHQQPLSKVEWICDNKEMHSCEDVFSFYSSSTAISQAICNTPEIMPEVSLNVRDERKEQALRQPLSKLFQKCRECLFDLNCFDKIFLRVLTAEKASQQRSTNILPFPLKTSQIGISLIPLSFFATCSKPPAYLILFCAFFFYSSTLHIPRECALELNVEI